MKAAGNLVLVGAREPVAFFAYPDKPSLLMPKDARSTKLAGTRGRHGGGARGARHRTRCHQHAARRRRRAAPARDARPAPITPASIASILGAKIPEGAIVVDESVTTGREFFPETAGAPPHDWINNRGGSIGYGLPVAIGAAIACPDRKVIALEGDGSAMYTIQSLWTMAREGLDVTVLIFANGTYNILRGELTNVGVRNPGPRAVDMLSIGSPEHRLGRDGQEHGRRSLPCCRLRAAFEVHRRRPQVEGAVSDRGCRLGIRGPVLRRRRSERGGVIARW